MTHTETTLQRRGGRLQVPREEPEWYAVHTQARSEITAYENLKRAGFWLYFPHRRVTVQRCTHSRWGAQRRLYEVDLPYFPRYLFACLRYDTDAIGDINDTVGVARVVCSRFSGIPLRIPNDVMDKLIEMTDSPEFEARFKQGPVLFEPVIGEQVIIDRDDSRSSFQGLKGIIASIEGLDKNRRIKVLAEMFGAEHEIEVAAERIAKLA